MPWSYVGETGTSFQTRKKEQIRNIKNFKKGSNIAKHARDYNHKIDFENGKIIDNGNYRTRKTLESWHTAIITNSDNNSKPLPKQYATLVLKKRYLLDYYFNALEANYSIDDPRSWKTICLKCNQSHDLTKPIACCF